MKQLRRRLLAASLASISALTLCSGAAAQPSEAGYPARPLRMLVGFAPGGSADTVARLLAQQLAASMGQPVIVENKAGAGGAIAADAVAKAPADGYSMVLLPSGHASSAAMRRSLPYDAIKDFAFVSTVTTYPMFVAVAAKSPITDKRIKSGGEVGTARRCAASRWLSPPRTAHYGSYVSFERRRHPPKGRIGAA